MFGTEIEFSCILGTGCFSTARSFLSRAWIGSYPFFFFFFLFLFLFSRDVAVNGTTGGASRLLASGCYCSMSKQHEWMDGWMDSSRRDYRVFLLYSTVYRPQRRLILHVTYLCPPMYLRSVSRVMVCMRYVCSLVDVWAARLVTMDKPPQSRTVRE